MVEQSGYCEDVGPHVTGQITDPTQPHSGRSAVGGQLVIEPRAIMAVGLRHGDIHRPKSMPSEVDVKVNPHPFFATAVLSVVHLTTETTHRDHIRAFESTGLGPSLLLIERSPIHKRTLLLLLSGVGEVAAVCSKLLQKGTRILRNGH